MAKQDDKSEFLEEIYTHVWSGLYDADEIVLMLTDIWVSPGDPDEAWIQRAVKKEFAKKKKQEATWPKTTDCDLLEDAFAVLEDEGIIALDDAGITKSDGLEDVMDVYEDAGGKESDYVGYCFYNHQDLEGVLANGDLWLSFGDIHGDARRGVKIGRRVKAALEEAGLQVKWSGTIGQRILVTGMRWQRRN
jgi:hypothetical protein